MRFSHLVCAALVALASMAAFTTATMTDYTPEALADEVHDLPGAPANVPFRQFAGYIPVDGGNRQIFYWFFEAYQSPESSPVMWWTSGGPGCAGTGVGGLGENGPFDVSKNGTLFLRPWAWNKFANTVYVDQPAGVGYSILDKEGTPYGDALSAKENYEFLVNFFKRFPNFAQNEFYLSSESYGGHYVPTLAKEISLHADSPLNFKGFVVGNPLTYMPYRDFAEVHTYATHQLVPDRIWREYTAKCYPDPKTPETNPPQARHADCDSLESRMQSYARGLDPYAIDFPVCTGNAQSRLFKTGSSKPVMDQKSMMQYRLRQAHSLYKTSILGDYFPENYEPCVETLGTAYMNQPGVRRALHVSPKANEWGYCANINYSSYDMITSMVPVYHHLRKHYSNKLKMLIFAGDNDAVCAPVGEQVWIWEQGWPVKKEWGAWKINGQVRSNRHILFNYLISTALAIKSIFSLVTIKTPLLFFST